MSNQIYDQLARNTGLLPENLSAAILAGKTPSTEDVLMHLLIAAQDGFAVVTGDSRSTMNEKRLSRMALAVAFLAAIAVVDRGEA